MNENCKIDVAKQEKDLDDFASLHKLINSSGLPIIKDYAYGIILENFC